MLTDQVPLCYRINAHDELIYVNEAWTASALAYGERSLESKNVLRRPLFEFIAGDTTQLIYRTLLQRVRGGHAVSFPLRCDTPTQQRLLEMIITPLQSGVVEFVTRELWREDRPPFPLSGVSTTRGPAPLLLICSWCQRVEIQEQQWVTLEEAVARLRLFEQTQLSRLSHGICSDCFTSLKIPRHPIRLQRGDADNYNAIVPEK